MESELDQFRTELANAQRKGEYQRVGELAYSTIPELEKKLAAIEASENTSVGEAVTADNIAQVVALDRHSGRQNAGGREGKADIAVTLEEEPSGRPVPL